jgi:DNA adenine methylase
MRDASLRRFPSPLRYPGGKGKISNFIKLLFLENDLVGHDYVEPYAGGASVALSLLFEEYASHIHLNDINRSVHAFWQATLNDTEALCQRIHDAPVTLATWKRQRTVQLVKDPDPLDLAFSTFFLNRTNRSGIISGGVIGGLKQSGEWKVDARYNKPALIQRIQRIARFGSRITLTRLDAAVLLQRTIPSLPRDTFLYLDPPYYIKGEGLYENFYKHEDHARIASLIRRLSRPWMVSYDNVPQIRALYAGFERIAYRLAYSAADKYEGGEVTFLSPRLHWPNVRSPANITAIAVDRAITAA